MNVVKESAELQELLEAMDTVIGETTVYPLAQHLGRACDDDIQPILDRIERREEQRKYAAKSGA
jgi:hypothetical protein